MIPSARGAGDYHETAGLTSSVTEQAEIQMASIRTVAEIVDHYLSEHSHGRTLADIAAELKRRTSRGSKTSLSAWRRGHRTPDIKLIRELRNIVGCQHFKYDGEAVRKAYQTAPESVDGSKSLPRRPAARGRGKGASGRQDRPDMTHMMPPLPRILADPGRRELETFTLKPMDRRGLLAPRLEKGCHDATPGASDRSLSSKGEGGIGKSVLLGQYLERLEHSTTAGVVLVSCALIEAGAGLTTLEAADQAFGTATGYPSAGEFGPLSLLSQSRQQHGEVVLLVDTLDLRITESNVVVLTRLLAEALRIGHVVVTCRAYEYSNLLEKGGHWLHARLNSLDIPLLTGEEIIDWAEAYLSWAAPEVERSPIARPTDRSV